MKIKICLVVLLAAAAWAQQIPLSIIVTPTRGEAERALAALHNGGDFAELARGISVDPTASSGGYMGVTDPANLRAELGAALAGISPGNLSPIVRIPSGFAFLKVLQSAPGAAAPQQARQAVSAAGSVRLTYDYAGFAGALRAVDKMPKPAGWDQDLSAACKVRNEAVPFVLGQITPLLANPAIARDAHMLVGDLNSYLGETAASVEHWTAALKLAESNAPDRVPQIQEALGVAYLQRAGRTLYGSYVFPRSLPRTKNADLDEAARRFTSYLEREPADGEVRWLLNLTHMLAGTYPAGVPPKFLIPPATFASKESAPAFRDVAKAAGIERVGQAGGAIADDFDGDGLIDIVISSVNDCEPLRLYHNDGKGKFTDRAAAAGLSEQTGGLNVIQTDYNNDGCLDLLVLRGGWEYGRRKSLLRSDCKGTFTDVTAASGLLDPVTATQTAAWTDIDNDGQLDLFVGNENAAAQLYLNHGDGTFTDIAMQAGVAKVGYTKGVVAGDCDNDGYPDLYVSALNGQHFLYRNNRDKTFTDVTKEAGVEGPWTTFGAMFFDYDNDGNTDLLVAGYGVSVEDVMNGYLGKPQQGESLHLYRNLGGCKFREVTSEVGLKRVFMPMGLNFGDIDNDGYLDLYLGSGNPSYASPVPNVMFHNQAGKAFSDVTAASGTGILPKGHGISFADFDGDGDEDIFVVMGGAVLGDRQLARLFQNPGNTNGWINLKLTGTRSNRAAIGARIHVTATSGGKTQHIYRTVSSGGSFGSSPLAQHIGVGPATAIAKIEVTWPGETTAETFPPVALRSTAVLQEGKGTR
ncbi:MAG: PpiC-type peptidyl-prolyl cis-trans isomerase [Bryobacterales bacterium]|nr:PpiC-type peptidyl-prolyl cis-trans isomerase [Bryobacterales bacterium]